MSDNFEQIETLMLNLALAVLFLMIGLAIRDVLKKASVPRFGRFIVWLVLTLGCTGFVAKGLIQFFWEHGGLH